jgi:ElaB/YqjD/DUF883 family membrane-anchored ribosome-binding protein
LLPGCRNAPWFQDFKMQHEPNAAEAEAAIANGAAAAAARSGVAREYHDFLSDLQDLIASTRASLGNAGGVIADRASAGAAVTDNYVRTQPWQAVGISAGLGLLIGFVLGRGRRDS